MKPVFKTNSAAEKDFVSKIHAAHDKAFRTSRLAIEQARDVGELLILAKAAVKEDTTARWIPWVEANLSFGRHQATKYMKLASNWDGIPENVKSAEHFSLEGIQKYIRPVTKILRNPNIPDGKYFELLHDLECFTNQLDRWIASKFWDLTPAEKQNMCDMYSRLYECVYYLRDRAYGYNAAVRMAEGKHTSELSVLSEDNILVINAATRCGMSKHADTVTQEEVDATCTKAEPEIQKMLTQGALARLVLDRKASITYDDAGKMQVELLDDTEWEELNRIVNEVNPYGELHRGYSRAQKAIDENAAA